MNGRNSLSGDLEFHAYAVRVFGQGAEAVYEVKALNRDHALAQAFDAFAGLEDEVLRSRLRGEVLHGPTF